MTFCWRSILYGTIVNLCTIAGERAGVLWAGSVHQRERRAPGQGGQLDEEASTATGAMGEPVATGDVSPDSRRWWTTSFA